ncbi:MAG: hypothetical protein ACLQOZ_08800 [Acidimicrobiales bacterium]
MDSDQTVGGRPEIPGWRTRRFPEGTTTESGFSMIATAASLIIGALLLAFALTSMLKSGGGSNASLTNAPGVGMADDLSAQQALTTSLTAAGSAAAAAGGYSGVTGEALSASNPSITYTDGASTGSSTVSVATSAGTGAGGELSGAGGGLTLAVRSSSGNCWLVWDGGGATWYGEQTDLPSCTAPALGTAPTASPVSSTTIGWRLGAFPSNA